MAPAAGVSPVSDRVPVMMPAAAVQPTALMSEAFAKDAIISWFRGEFAAANAIIDALCGHLSQFEGGRCEYESVFAAIHRRRLNWIPILQMQKYFSIADVTHELQKVAEVKEKLRSVEKIVEENVSSPVIETKREILEEKSMDVDGNGVGEVVDDDFANDNSPKSGITDAGKDDSCSIHTAIYNYMIPFYVCLFFYIYIIWLVIALNKFSYCSLKKNCLCQSAYCLCQIANSCIRIDLFLC